MTQGPKLLTFEFLGLCIVTFLSFCNFTVFYNLFNYLSALGIDADLRGLVIGSFSLTSMLVYLLASPFLRAGNAARTMLLGIIVVALCGQAYLFIDSFWGIMALRLTGGIGQSLVSAGAMALFVSVIPQDKSGQAFAVYSVAMLLPYAAVPALMDAIAPLISSPPWGYAGATLTLLPAAWIVLKMQHRRLCNYHGDVKRGFPAWADIRANVSRLPVALLIILNMIYMLNWSSIFYLFKGFADLRGIANVGSFFSVQMGLMIAFRLFAGRLFDVVDKALLMTVSFIVIAAGHLALDHLPGPWAVPLVAAVFGAGTGLGLPTLYGLMFDVTEPRFRPLNASLMLFAVQVGFFLGPVIGGALVIRWGYHGYFLFSTVAALATSFVSIRLSHKGVSADE